METIYQYETAQWEIKGPVPEGSFVDVDICAQFTPSAAPERAKTVKGFYAGGGTYIVRFYPEECGIYECRIRADFLDEEKVWKADCLPAKEGRHGMVRAQGTHFKSADGNWFYPFGTTVYAMIHQEDALVEQTYETLGDAPFNKIRICVFPKHYEYNHNEPPCFAFERNEDGSWDANHPCMEFWNRLEVCIKRLDSLGIECDLILFHSYDRWGFSKLPLPDALVYLDYLMRRLCAFPNVWWSLANEYDLMDYKKSDWECFAHFISTRDPYGHLLSNHQAIRPWDYSNADTTHICTQTSELAMLSGLIRKYNKPLMVDECRYEGNLQDVWGNLSGFELVHRFWTICAQGGYATHGETFLDPDDIIWWAKGGKLKGQSPERIGFLKGIIEEIGGPLTYAGPDFDEETFDETMKNVTPEMIEKDVLYMLLASFTWDEAKTFIKNARDMFACYEDRVFLRYYGRQCAGKDVLVLPESGTYKIELIDIWEMTRTPLLENAHGRTQFTLPGKEGMAVLAVRN